MVGPGEPAVGRMAVASTGQGEVTPQSDISLTVDNTRRGTGDNEEVPGTENAVPILTTTQRDAPAGSVCAICYEDQDQTAILKRMWKCEHLIHEDCWEEWLKTIRHARLESLPNPPRGDGTPPCAFCRADPWNGTPAPRSRARTAEEAAAMAVYAASLWRRRRRIQLARRWGTFTGCILLLCLPLILYIIFVSFDIHHPPHPRTR
ncbi:hypothetical protein PCANC_17599 [Puccinia coronata f. sp. avenae]|uniref:RING-type domain-containing protein n=1 Tax=Puccinia coronata f. sp. avenae TaxID=200324 RepID=A0A2N5VMY6_9BASI|nr:hypothetical protein PCASD_22699 [Puccinia coronata f. sp. avenae]PLW51365.1 hypothetical protein PCANC_17599 [Puccinia coronata f. sp. avenae]